MLHIKKLFIGVGCFILFVYVLNLLKCCYKSNSFSKQEKFQHKKTASIEKCSDKTSCLSAGFFTISENENKKVNSFNIVSPTQNETGYFGRPIVTIMNVTDWKRTDMQTLSARQIGNYFLWTNQSSCRITQYFGGVMVSTANGLVSLDGQKAICLDDIVRPIGAIPGATEGCLVYSFGINNEWSFDDAMDLYGCKIFSFDPSMNVSNHNRTKNIHFYGMALGNDDKDVWGNSSGVQTRTLRSIYEMLSPMHGGAIIDYLKMDIESTEWEVLPQIMKSGMLDKVRQLAVEIHVDVRKCFKLCRQHASVLQLLENYGMVRFDSKPNVHTLVNSLHQINSASVFNGYEIAWYNNKLRRDNFTLFSSVHVFPTQKNIEIGRAVT